MDHYKRKELKLKLRLLEQEENLNKVYKNTNVFQKTLKKIYVNRVPGSA